MALRLLMTADAVGGVWTYALDLATGLAAYGVETTLVVLGPSPDPQQAQALERVPGASLIDSGLPLDWLSDAAGTRRAAAAVAQLARRIGADVVHLNSPALAAAADWPVPVVGVAHGCLAAWWRSVRPDVPLDPELAWHSAMMAQGLLACTRRVAPTAAFARSLAEVYGLGQPPVAVHNGRVWQVGPQREPPAPFVLSAGRMWDEAKNAAVLDEVAGLIDWPLEVAGPFTGPHGQQSRSDHLVPLGSLAPEALAERLRRRPVFVSTARFEPFGLAVLEAAASGCALVLADIPSFRELWDGAAHFVPCDDSQGFAERIGQLMQSPPARLAWGERARRRAARYSVPRMAAAMMTEYRAALRAGTRPKEVAA